MIIRAHRRGHWFDPVSPTLVTGRVPRWTWPLSCPYGDAVQQPIGAVFAYGRLTAGAVGVAGIGSAVAAAPIGAGVVAHDAGVRGANEVAVRVTNTAGCAAIVVASPFAAGYGW